jgi:hypothetical protein
MSLASANVLRVVECEEEMVIFRYARINGGLSINGVCDNRS